MALTKYEDIFGEFTFSHSSEEPHVPLGFWDGIKWLPLNENILVIGDADIGRTAFLRSIVFYAISQYQPETLLLWLYHAGLCTFKDFSNYQIPHIMMDGTDETTESVTALIDALDREITIRQTLLASKSGVTSFADYFKTTGTALAPKGIVLLNFAEILLRRLRALPHEYTEKFSRIVRVSQTLGICIIMCIHDYADFLWPYGLREVNFPRKVAITRTDCSDPIAPATPVALLSTDYSLPWLSPIWLSQGTLQHLLGNLFPPK